jgi:hypothetical protein
VSRQWLTVFPDGCGGDYICVGYGDGEQPLVNPHAFVSLKMVTAIMTGTYRPSRGQDASIERDILRIAAHGRTVVYRLGRFCPEAQEYEAEWPD